MLLPKGWRDAVRFVLNIAMTTGAIALGVLFGWIVIELIRGF